MQLFKSPLPLLILHLSLFPSGEIMQDNIESSWAYTDLHLLFWKENKTSKTASPLLGYEQKERGNNLSNVQPHKDTHRHPCIHNQTHANIHLSINSSKIITVQICKLPSVCTHEDRSKTREESPKQVIKYNEYHLAIIYL